MSEGVILIANVFLAGMLVGVYFDRWAAKKFGD